MSFRETLAPLVVCLLVVLAGCGGVLGGSPTESPSGTDTTPGDGTTTTTMTPGDVNESALPPGVTADGIENVSALLAAHTESLRSSGFIASATSEQVLKGQMQQSQRTELHTRATAGFRDVRTTANVTNPRGAQNSTYWGNASQLVRRVQQGNQTQFTPVPASVNNTAFVTLASNYRGFLGIGDYQVSNVNQSGEGTRVRLVATSVGNGTGAITPENVSAFESRVVLDGDGTIRSISLDMNVSAGARTVEYTLQGSVEYVGQVSVEKPSWAEEAFAQTTQAELSATVEDGVVALTNHGPEALTSQAQVLTNYASGERRPSQVAFNGTIPAGETRYFAVQDGNVTLVAEPPSNPPAVEQGDGLIVVGRSGTPILQTTLGANASSGNTTAPAGVALPEDRFADHALVRATA